MLSYSTKSSAVLSSTLDKIQIVHIIYSVSLWLFFVSFLYYSIGAQHLAVMALATWQGTMHPTEGNNHPITWGAVLRALGWQQQKEVALILCASFSLSGCPRARKGGIKVTPTKEEKEDPELKWVQKQGSTTSGGGKWPVRVQDLRNHREMPQLIWTMRE